MIKNGLIFGSLYCKIYAYCATCTIRISFFIEKTVKINDYNKKKVNMDSELTIILKQIKQKTGIDVDAYAETKKFSATTREEPDWILPSEPDFLDVFSDGKNDKTFFHFRFRNANLIGSISGAGEIEKNYAYLIMSLLDSTSAKDENLGFREQMKSILLGDYTKQQVQKFMRKFSVPDIRCFVAVIVSLDGKTEKVMESLKKFLSLKNDSLVLTEDMTCSMIKFLSPEDDVDPAAFAQNVYNNLSAENMDVRIGVSGTVANLLYVNNAYLQATTAIRLAKTYASPKPVNAFKDHVLEKMLEDIPKFLLSEYLTVLEKEGAQSIFNDNDMLTTAEALFNNNLNVSLTARELYMHRNTLIYRIDKIEKETGLNIQKFSDALTFKLAATIKKILA